MTQPFINSRPSFKKTYKHYSTVCYDDLFIDYRANLEGEFIQRKALYFADYVGFTYFLGKDLLHYPALTKALRLLPHYPTFEKNYAVDDRPTGMDFIRYFLDHVLNCELNFQKELAKHHIVVNHLIHLFGTEWKQPIIAGISEARPLTMIINGINWKVASDYQSNVKNIDCLNVRELFDIHNNFNKIHRGIYSQFALFSVTYWQNL